MSGDSIPTVTEDAATGEVAAIYADIRATLGVPVVNLIWRHLAAVPGGLGWAWSTARPIYAGGRLRAAAKCLREGIELPPVTPFDPAVLQAAGVGAGDEDTIRRLLATYRRGNSLNLIALSALWLRLRGEGSGRGTGTYPEAAPEPSIGPVPPLLALDELDARTAETVCALNRIASLDGGMIVVSLFRHLAYWPGLLRLYLERLQPLDEAATLAGLRDVLLAEAECHARTMSGALADVPLPDPSITAPVRSAVEGFRRNLIARMLALGAVMIALLPGRRAAPPDVRTRGLRGCLQNE